MKFPSYYSSTSLTSLTSFFCLLCAAVVSASAADLPKIVYTKSFPRSKPEYVEITVDKDGQGQYKESPDDDSPLDFKLAPSETAEIFSLAAKLDHFKRPLESNLKVANTGIKTFRYENGPEKNEVKFNYSLDPDARTLWDWFERITETEQRFIDLQRTAKFDKLGVNQALLQLQATVEKNRLVAKEQFLPLLDRVARNETYLHMARERAAALAELFRKFEAPAQ